VNIRREKTINYPQYDVLIKLIDRIKHENRGRIIYVSLGTGSIYDIKRITKFLTKMIKVTEMNPQHLFIFSTGKYFDISRLLPIPDNLRVFESVPQIDLLHKCDIMITHGGMNSITECVFTETPMLVYPLSRRWDQPGNSARVIYYEIGLRGRIERDSARSISRKIARLNQDYPQYKKNIIRMKQLFEEQNNSKQIVDIITQIIKKNEVTKNEKAY